MSNTKCIEKKPIAQPKLAMDKNIEEANLKCRIY